MAGVPPRPPPHSQQQQQQQGGSKANNLPNGNYDIFIIPPHSAGSGFLYLPSLKPNINSFVAGFCTCLVAVCIYNILVPALQQAFSSLNPGVGLLFALAAAAVAFSVGRTTMDGSGSPFARGGDGSGGRPSGHSAEPEFTFPSASSSSSSAPPPHGDTSASSSWEKAKEETKRREAERKRTEEARQQAEAAARRKEDADQAARAAAEKDRWEQARAREKDTREREARERIARERAARSTGDAAAATAAAAGQPKGRYEKPSAQSAADSGGDSGAYKRPFAASASSSAASSASKGASSYAPSASTARTDPPPATASGSQHQRGPYKTADPNKVMVCGVYLFTAGFPKPVSMLVKGRDGVTDGLILRITTEGLFIDDDVRGVPQREWDVKAWGIKLVETGKLDNLHVFRASIRDLQEKKYVFVLPAEQAWKVDIGLERLRKGSQVRAMGMSGIKDAETKGLLHALGWK